MTSLYKALYPTDEMFPKIPEDFYFIFHFCQIKLLTLREEKLSFAGISFDPPMSLSFL